MLFKEIAEKRNELLELKGRERTTSQNLLDISKKNVYNCECLQFLRNKNNPNPKVRNGKK